MKIIKIAGLAMACTGVLLGCGAVSYLSQNTASPVIKDVKPGQTASSHDRPNPSNRSKPGTSEAARPAAAPRQSVASGQPAALSAGYSQRVGDQAVAPDGKVYPLRTYKALSMPNDPSANQPWVATANISGAWDTPRGSSPTLLAVIDTGFALQHEELKDRWYANPREQVNNIDDDGNGLVDDVRGWDFAHADNSPQAGQNTSGGAGGRHGTYVAGVAAASGNNGLGIAGVDWGTIILPIQALGEDGTGYNVDVANAIYYAAAQGADVISLSLGSSQADPLVREAIRSAIAGGSIVVAAAGNDGCDCMVYPANYPEVVAVGASASNGQPASFSSYGANLDVLAPGVNLYTTDWQSNNPTSAYAGGISGTSLATPVISGLLTRLKSFQPSATPLQLVAALTENTNRLTLGSTTSRTNQLGFGLVDAGRATLRLTTPYSPTQIHIFTPVSFGNALSQQQPAEVPAGSALAYQCTDSQHGTTPVYELSKPNIAIFSASPSETRQAIEQGYNADFFSYVCLSQPHDNPRSILRNISLHKEFRNRGEIR